MDSRSSSHMKIKQITSKAHETQDAKDIDNANTVNILLNECASSTTNTALQHKQYYDTSVFTMDKANVLGACIDTHVI